MTDFDNVTINDTLTMKAPNQQDYINIKTVWVTYPTEGPILRISQGIWGMKDFSCLGFLGSVSKTVVTFGATYTNCVPSDIGKLVKDDGVDTSVLAYYNNEEKEWWLAGASSVASGSSMTIVNGTGAGTSSGNSSTYGGGAILMGHGLNGVSDPPKIVLMDSAQGYDTLYLKKTDGSPAHLDLGNLTAHGYVVSAGVTTLENASTRLFIGRYSAAFPYSYIAPSANSSGFKWNNAAITAEIMTLTNNGLLTLTALTVGGTTTLNGNTIHGGGIASNFNPSAANTYGIGSGSYYWAGVVCQTIYRRYESSFDALDDLGLIKQYRTKTIIKDGIEQEVIDIESLPHLRADAKPDDPELVNFWDENKVSGFMMGCIKALVLRTEKLEEQLKSGN
jgi:hypothetical protein